MVLQCSIVRRSLLLYKAHPSLILIVLGCWLFHIWSFHDDCLQMEVLKLLNRRYSLCVLSLMKWFELYNHLPKCYDTSLLNYCAHLIRKRLLNETLICSLIYLIHAAYLSFLKNYLTSSFLITSFYFNCEMDNHHSILF